MSGAPRSKTSPLRATVPLSCVTKQGSGLRSPGAPFRGAGSPRAPKGLIRRTASLDAIYLRGLFPRESLFWHRDRATQTERASSLDSLQAVGAAEGVTDRVAKLTVRPRRASCSRDDGMHVRNQPSPVLRSSASVPPPKSSRNSEEGLNQELELYASAEPLPCNNRLQEPIPEGRKAPVAELIRERPFSRTRHSATQNSSEDSQGSSPDQDRMVTGSSPHINRFSSRAPPDGCERVLSKSVPILRPIPREVVSSHPNTLFTLKPSCHSAFETLQRSLELSNQDKEEDKDRDSPKVPDQEDP
ncbi:hypothetical protein Zmor_027016 [Zophobas morio]|uniref:Uncharacterized protein n=1 Tax=Zophobas morio TaxID=2755281 RepID=A0AA38HWX5_9CUCU|nr:hypothetical protein Zmor_027016 [Zophobas morio]